MAIEQLLSIALFARGCTLALFLHFVTKLTCTPLVKQCYRQQLLDSHSRASHSANCYEADTNLQRGPHLLYVSLKRSFTSRILFLLLRSDADLALRLVLVQQKQGISPSICLMFSRILVCLSKHRSLTYTLSAGIY